MKTNKRKICTAKQRRELIKWLSSEAETVLGFYSEALDVSENLKDVRNKLAENYTKTIANYEKQFTAFLLADEFDKKCAATLVQELLDLSKEICTSYEKGFSSAREELADVYNVICFLLAFLSKDGVDFDSLNPQQDD